MTDNTVLKIEFDHFFGDAERKFALPHLRLVELEEKTSAGPMVLYRRLADGTATSTDIRETIRLGLIGGGLKPAEAETLLRRYHDPLPIEANLGLATTIIAARVFGVEPTDVPPLDDAVPVEAVAD